MVLQICGSRVCGCICILGLGPVYLREILSPFLCVCACMHTEARGGFQVFLLLCVCVCVVCVYAHACVRKPEVDFSSAFVISVLFLRQDLSSNLECTSLARPAGPQARGLCTTALHCKHVPTWLLFTSGATDQAQVLRPVQRALY